MPEPAPYNGHRPERAPWRLMALLGIIAVLILRLLSVWRSSIQHSPEPAPQAIPAGPATHQPERPATAFEPSDWSLAPVAVVYIGALVLIVICCFVLIAAYPTSLPDVGRTLRIAPPGPRLQTSPQDDLQRFRAQEDKRLNTYYWIDKKNGVVHIPIEQAMQDLVKTGVAGFPKGQQ